MYARALAIGIIVVLLGLSGAASSWAHGAARGRASEHALRNAETRILGANLGFHQLSRDPRHALAHDVGMLAAHHLRPARQESSSASRPSWCFSFVDL